MALIDRNHKYTDKIIHLIVTLLKHTSIMISKFRMTCIYDEDVNRHSRYIRLKITKVHLINTKYRNLCFHIFSIIWKDANLKINWDPLKFALRLKGLYILMSEIYLLHRSMSSTTNKFYALSSIEWRRKQKPVFIWRRSFLTCENICHLSWLVFCEDANISVIASTSKTNF